MEELKRGISIHNDIANTVITKEHGALKLDEWWDIVSNGSYSTEVYYYFLSIYSYTTMRFNLSTKCKDKLKKDLKWLCEEEGLELI